MPEHSNPCALFTLKTCARQLFKLAVFLLFAFSTPAFAQTFSGQVTTAYSLEWNGTAYLRSGFPGQAFPSFTLYENQYYVFDNNSSNGETLVVGENNQTSYGGNDLWNNLAIGDDEYLLLSPDGNSSRTLYYFKPEQNATTGQFTVLPYDSLLRHPNLSLDDSRFGHAVETNDWNQSIVGAPGQVTLDGAVYVFNRESNGSQTQLQVITPPALDGQFGASLKASGEFLAVGAPDESAFRGKTYLYKRQIGGNYALWETHAPPVPMNGDSFGWRTAMEGSHMVISSLQRENALSGKLNYYRKNADGTWSFQSSFSSDNNQSADEFGHAVDLSGGRLLAGAPLTDSDGNNSGSAYVFELNGTSWIQTQKLSPSSLSVDDKFGFSVALSGNLAFVGSVNGDSNVTNTGCIFVFEYDGLTWAEVAKIDPPTSLTDQLFSFDLEYEDGLLLVGAPQSGEDGYGYIYRMGVNSGSWNLISSLDCKEAVSSNKDSTSVSLSNGMAIVGSPGDSTVQSFGGGTLFFYNDAWKSHPLPELPPLIDGNSTPVVHFTEVEDQNYSVSYFYDLNGSHPFSNILSWAITDANVSAGDALYDLNSTSGLLSYRPDANFSGVHTFQVSLSRGSSSDSVLLSVVVDGTPDRPVFSDINQFTLPPAMEGDAYNVPISLFDADGDLMTLTLQSGSLPANCTIAANSIVGTPTMGSAQGAASHTYTFDLNVSDGVLSSVQSFQLTVLERNEPPFIEVNGSRIVQDVFLTLPEDANASTWYSLLPLLSYGDPDGHQMELNASVLPANGSLLLELNASSNQSVRYLPAADFNGSDAFTIRLKDVQGQLNKFVELNFHLTITPVNDAPVITSAPPSQQAPEGSLFSYQLAVSDVDQGDSVTISYSNLPPWLSFDVGTFVFSGTPSWSDYEPSGPRLILIEATDSAGAKDSQGFLLEVVPLNYPPSIVQGDSIAVQVNEDSNFSDWPSLGITATDQDGAAGSLTWLVLTAPTHGQTNVSGTGVSPTSLAYRPDANFTGQDSFVVKVYDSGDVNAMDTILIQVSVLPVADAPVFTSSTSGIAVKGFAFEYNATVFDADGQQGLAISVLSPIPSWVSFVDEGNGTARFTGTPQESDVGDSLMVLEGRDPTNRFAQQVFFLKVLDENRNPVITQGSSISFTATEDTTWVGDGLLSASDADGQPLSWGVAGNPLNGSVVASGQGGTIQRLEYIPDANYSGSDSFVISVGDGVGESRIMVNLIIENVADAPVFSAFPISQSIIDENLLSLSVVAYDADGLSGAVVNSVLPAWLNVDLSNFYSTGTILLRGTPNFTDEGQHAVSMTVTDSTGLSKSASFVVTVDVHNYPPSISGNAFSVQMTEDLPGTWTVPSLSATDVETGMSDLIWTVSQAPSRGTASFTDLNDPSSLTYFPDGNFSGQDSFVVSVTDLGGIQSSAPKSVQAVITVNVSAVNDLPVFISVPTTDLANGTYSWNDESEYVYQVKAYDSDWDWQSIDLNVTSVLPSWLTFQADSNGTGILRGTGAVKDKGTYSIQFTATDSNGTFVNQTFDLILRIDNYPPVFKSLETNREIPQLIVYLDEDSVSGGVRGWVTPQNFLAEDPDPQLQNPLRAIEWSLGSSPRSLAKADVNGTGLRPQVFTYESVQHFNGNDLFHLKAFDGHRYSLLPVNVVVRPVPDPPAFTSSIPAVINSKVGATLKFPIETKDVDGDSRSIKILGLPKWDDGFWLGITDLNTSSGQAYLEGTPPLGERGSKYPIAIVVTDSTGRYATANTVLLIEGENRSPFIRGPETVKLAFDKSGQSKASDLTSILATDFDGDSLTWSLSPSSEHKYGVPKASGIGPRPTILSYSSYGSQAADSFTIRVADKVSFDELNIIPLLVQSHGSAQVDFLKGNDEVEAGTEYSNYFSLSGLSDYTVIEASLIKGPSWLRISQVSKSLFRLSGFVPYGVSGNFDLQFAFTEGGIEVARETLLLKISVPSSLSLALQGDDFVRLRKGLPFAEPGFEANGTGGVDLTGSVTRAGNTASSANGVFKLDYKLNDLASGKEVSSSRYLVVSEGNSSVAVSSLTQLDPRKVNGVLPLDGTSLVWGEGSNVGQALGSENSVSFLSKIDTAGNLLANQVIESLSGQKALIEDCIATSDGNFLLVGKYSGTLSYGKYRFAAKGTENAFILKTNSSLDLLWSKTFSCSGKIGKLRVCSFQSDSVLLGGSFSSDLVTDTGTFASVAGNDLFITRMHLSDGEVSWVKRLGGSGDDSATALTSMGDLIYFAGGVSKTSAPAYSFLFEMDQNGVALTSRSFKGFNQNQIKELSVGMEQIFVLGSFDSSLSLPGGNLNSLGSSSFAMCLGRGLVQQWASVVTDLGQPLGLDTDAFGFPVILTRFRDSVSVPESSVKLASSGQGDLLMAKLHKKDGSFLWHKQLGGIGDENASDLKIDSYGKVFALLSSGQSFQADSFNSGSGSLLLATVESVAKPTFVAPLDLNLTKEESFYHEISANAPLGFCRMELIGAPNWVQLKDDRNGSGVLGGAVGSDANSSVSFMVRAYDLDGGYSDLAVRCRITDSNQSSNAQFRFPDFSSSLSLGANVLVSQVNAGKAGNYLVIGKFKDSLQVGGLKCVSQSGYDGFALKFNSSGQAEDLMQLVSTGEVNLIGSATDEDGNVYLSGYFSGSLSVGFLEIKSAGLNDLFIVSWSKNGDLLDLQGIGGGGDERVTSMLSSGDSLILGGYFRESFGHSTIFRKSIGGDEGFVLSLSTSNFQQVNWVSCLQGASDEQVLALAVGEDKAVYIAGRFEGSSSMAGAKVFSKGLTDAFIGKLSVDGKVQYLRSGGGAGKEEINFLERASNSNLIVGGIFSGEFEWDSQRLSSKGAVDAFLGTVSSTGNCLSLFQMGGAGSERLTGLLVSHMGIFVTGTFNGKLELDSNNVFQSRGGVDAFCAIFDFGAKSIRQASHFGETGDDVLLGAATSFSGNYLLGGVSKSRLGIGFTSDPTFTDSDSAAFLSRFGPSSFSPSIWPLPPGSVKPSSSFEYAFSSGPWPNNARPEITIKTIPSWLSASLRPDGSGLIWGMTPSSLAPGEISFPVDLSIGSPEYGKADLRFAPKLLSSQTSFHLVCKSSGNSIPQYQKFSLSVTISGNRSGDVIIYPEALPSWLKGTRVDDSRYLLEGTPGSGYSGSNQVRLRALSPLHSELLNLELSVQSPLYESSTKTNSGDWKESWFGFFVVFENSWSYHQDLGWVFVESSQSAKELWFWNEKWGWLWTSSDHWNGIQREGFLYSFKSGNWIYFRKGSPSLVYLYETGEWAYYENQ